MDTLKRIDYLIDKGWSLRIIRSDGTYCFKKSVPFSSTDNRILYHYGFLKDNVWRNHVSFEDDWDDKFYQLFLLEKEASDNWAKYITSDKKRFL